MAFKRYIHRHGKKLGPYYYENVKSPDGKVKTVYLGTNPSHHPKHRIRKPLLFLIIALVLILILGGSLFFLQNKAYLIKKARIVEPDFDVDQILLKVLIRSNEFIEKQIRVMNTGSEQSGIDVEISGLDIIKIDDGSFILKPGQTKIVTLNFSSFMPEQKIEQQPGIYIGKLVVKSHNALKEIPVVVEIETKNVLFDMNLNPVAIERKVKQGADTTIEVRLFNLESIESQNVDVEYFVKDMNGNTIVTESETAVVKTQASFFKTVSIPKNLKPGPYVFAAQAKFGNSIGTSSYLFEVTEPEVEASFVQFCKNNVLCLGLSLTTILLLFALTAYFYFFIGAYLYERVTGVVTLPKKKKEEIEESEEAIERLGIFDKIRNRIDEWKKERELKKAKKEGEEELQRLAETRKAQLDARKGYLEEERRKQEELRKNLEEERKKQEALRKEVLLKKQRELEKQKAEQEERIMEEKLIRQREFEAKQRAEAKRKEKSEREKIWKERKEKATELLRKIGLLITPEEKRQIALQKERERKERLRQEEQLKREKEKQRLAEENKREELKRQKEEEQRRRQLEEEEKKREKLRKQEEIGKQKELERQRIEEGGRRKEEELRKQRELEQKRKEEEERQKQEDLRKQKEAEQRRKEEERIRALEEERKFEGERRIKLEQEERQRELERQRQEQIKAKKSDEISQVETQFEKNKKIAELLNFKLSRIESERKPLLSSISKIDAKAKQIDDEILSKSQQSDDLKLKRVNLSEKYKKELAEFYKKQEAEKAAHELKIKELKAKLIAKQDALTKDLESELSKLSPNKRAATEKWKRLELKAKLKLEEHSVEEEIKKYLSKADDEKAKVEESYKKSLGEISKKSRELKQEITDLESQKEQILHEKGKLSEDLQNKNEKIQKIRLKLELNSKEREKLEVEFSKLKAELPKFKVDFFSNLISTYKDKFQKIRDVQEQQKAKLEEERRKEEGALKKQREHEEKLRKIEEEKKRKEEERIAKEKQKGTKQEEKLRLKEELRKQRELEQKRKEEERQRILEEKRRFEEEKRQKELERQKVEEAKRKLEGERKRQIEEEKEEKPIVEVAEEKKPKKKWFAGLFKKEKPELGFKGIGGYTEEEPVPEKKPLVFGKILQKAEREEKPAEQKKPKSEVEELEEAIRSLGLFRKIEKGKIKPTEKLLEEKPSLLKRMLRKGEKETPAEEIEQEKPAEAKESIFKRLFRKPRDFSVKEEKPAEERKEAIEQPELIGKSRQFEKCYNVLNKVKEAVANGNISKAKKIYVEAREIYISLEDEEKKEVYDELMDLYNKLK